MVSPCKRSQELSLSIYHYLVLFQERVLYNSIGQPVSGFNEKVQQVEKYKSFQYSGTYYINTHLVEDMLPPLVPLKAASSTRAVEPVVDQHLGPVFSIPSRLQVNR